MVQHYIEEIAEPSHLRLVSHSDVFAATGIEKTRDVDGDVRSRSRAKDRFR